MCPYYVDGQKKCGFGHGYYGEYPDLAQRDRACVHSDNWKRCETYTRSSLDEKVAKKVRPNPDL